MNSRKIIVNGVEIDAQQLIAQGWKPPEEPRDIEPTKEHEGCLVEVSRARVPVRWQRRRLVVRFSKDTNYPYKTEDNQYKHARLITDGYPVAMIPWRGGECPVADGALTLLLLRDGHCKITKSPEVWRWTNMKETFDITHYCPLDLRGLGGSNE